MNNAANTASQVGSANAGTDSAEVLAKVDRAFGVLDGRGARATADELATARAAIAELIESDREYDAAKEDLATQRRQVGAIDPATFRLREAIKRRAAALANMGPAA